MNSVRSKLIKNFLIVIVSTVIILDIFMIVFFKEYYYKNRQYFLTNQIESSINFYDKYFSSQTLIQNIYDNIDSFWNNINAQVEILDPNGKLLMDSIGIRDDKLLQTPDIGKAINGETARWVGKSDYYHGNIMIVSHPIIINGELNGIIRVISSLEDIDNTINAFIILFLIISSIVILIGLILSILMAKSIVDPIKSITKVAKKMASGDLKIKSSVYNNEEITQLSNTLNYMASEIEKREKLKNEFISSVSHELRTPLTAIKGWVITLNDDETDKETLKMGFDIIEKETDRLTLMVEELLDFSKLVSGIVHLNKRNVDIRSFVTHIENYMKPRAVNEDIVFNVDISNNVSKGFFDYNKMKQVLINILDNAFKFTDKERKVSLFVDQNESDIKFTIIDSGVGISEEELPKVKEKFYKGKNSNSQNGIGLSICDEIIKLHKGTFNIESELGKGTSVKITIPNIKEEK